MGFWLDQENAKKELRVSKNRNKNPNINFKNLFVTRSQGLFFLVSFQLHTIIEAKQTCLLPLEPNILNRPLISKPQVVSVAKRESNIRYRTAQLTALCFDQLRRWPSRGSVCNFAAFMDRRLRLVRVLSSWFSDD